MQVDEVATERVAGWAVHKLSKAKAALGSISTLQRQRINDLAAIMKSDIGLPGLASAGLDAPALTAVKQPVLDYTTNLMRLIIGTATLKSLAKHRSDAFNVWLQQLQESEDQWVEWLWMWQRLDNQQEGVPPPTRVRYEGNQVGEAARLAASGLGADESKLSDLRRLHGLFVQRLMNALRKEILNQHGAACKVSDVSVL